MERIGMRPATPEAAEPFDHTSTALAQVAGCSLDYVSRLAVAGSIDFITASNGIRLYRKSAAQTVRAIKAEGLARRGRWRRIQQEQRPRGTETSS